MASLRLAIVGGGLFGAALVGACGLEAGGPNETGDSGMDPDVLMVDTADAPMPDAPIDVMTPDLGTGETESGVMCTCTPALPLGWTFAAYAVNQQNMCPKSYGMQQDTIENPTAAASTCTCNCNGGITTQPTCGGGDVNFTYGFGTANNSCAKLTGTLACSPGCKNLNINPSGSGGDFAYLSMSGTIAPAGGACAKENVVQTFPQPTSTATRVCPLQGTPDTCGNLPCVPTPAAGYAVCITRTGLFQCPADFPNLHQVGDDILDTRSCGPACVCTLAKGNCTTQVSSYFGSSDCTAGAWGTNPQTPNGVCQATGYGGGNGSFQSCKYTSTSSGASCTATANFGPTGNLGLKNPATVCCL